MLRRLLLLPLLGSLASAHPAWRALDAEPGRHVATVAGWTLTVDASRARLVSALPPGGSAEDNILLAGGHRVWLGPQAEWPAFWPPPADWEGAPADSVTLSADASELTVVHPRADPRHPALVRRYRVDGDSLLLAAAWRIDNSDTEVAVRSRQAVHILQLRPDAVVRLVPAPTAEAPLGHGLLALAVRPGTDLASPVPAALGGADHAGALHLSLSGAEEKIGVPPQPLVARFPSGAGLRLLPAGHDGVIDPALPAPEAGLFTQVYFGATAWAMTEIEQLSPRLLPAREDGWIECVVRLEFLAPPAP